MEKEKMDEKIIVTSDKMGIIEMAGGCSIVTLMLIGVIISYIVDMYKDGVEMPDVILIISFVYISKIIICSIITYWIAIGRRILMDQEGCHISFHGYSRFYRWDEIQVKRYEKGPARLTPARSQGVGLYYEGVFFSVLPIDENRFEFKEQSGKGYFADSNPYAYCVAIEPWSTFFVNFYPYGISEGCGDYKSQVQAVKEYRKRKHMPGEKRPKVTRHPELYPVDKGKFLACMELWHVEIKGLTEMDKELYAEESLGIGKFNHF